MAPNTQLETRIEGDNAPPKDSKDGVDIETKKSPPSSLPGFQKYPEFRNLPIYHKTGMNWLKSKRDDDDVSGLWRVHNKLYDFSDFVSIHPGGDDWLQLTKGTDITELFETSHFGGTAEKFLDSYYVKEATNLRNSPYTFKPDGFYKTVKARAEPILKEVGRGPSTKMNMIQNALLLGMISALLGSAAFKSYILVTAAGVMLGMIMICSHNFLHQKNNWRMYVFDLSLMSFAEWRISHVISHHVYPNTILDWEVACLDPVYDFLPSKRNWWHLASFAHSHIIHLAVLPFELFKRAISMYKGEQELRWFNLLPFMEFLAMAVVAPSIWSAMWFFGLFQIIGSYWFMWVGLTVGHHHPDNFHDGDAAREDTDWGLCQLDAVQDRVEVTGNLFLTSTMFGDHALHHLFPTVDHSKLPYLYPALEKTCKEFGIDYRVTTQLNAIRGFFMQCIKEVPSAVPLDQIKKNK